MSVLITGATGFLGTQVTRRILEQTDLSVIVFVRGRDLSDAKHRLESTWWDWPNMVCEIGRRIQVVNGDLCLSRFGLSNSDYEELADKISHIIHLAADIRLNEPLAVLQCTNVEGVRNVLELAYDAHSHHGLSRFSYVSTAYVAGRRKGIVPEEALTDRFGFSNHYELSKFEGESLVREAGKELPVSVFRPGMVVGDSISGAVKTFNTMYFPLRLYLTGKLKIFPVDPSLKINMVPCDYVSEAIVKLTFDPKAGGLNFHLTLPADALPTVREMIDFTREWATENLHIKLPAPVFLPVKVSRFQWLDRFLKTKSAVRSLLSLASYFEEDRIYLRDNLDRLLGTYPSNWSDFFPQILTYAADHGFMHRSERTVHEQAYFRLTGKSRLVNFYDVIPGKIVSRSSDDVRREIEMSVSAMNRLGIRSGDRIAIVGFNSSRYFAIDVAVGLTGGISVPLYYSSPTHELAEIIDGCGASLLFVGLPEILVKLAGDKFNKPVVSFCRERPQCDLPENFMSWQDFLMVETDSEATAKAPTDYDKAYMKSPASFGDIATLRYTSGTTGRPKGAAFDHSSLRRMAESLASLPPWKARTQKVVYLSFLPMNHVVEGILASYAIYNTPAPIDVYYLENFHELQKVLPKIQPTVFFSVPRFYEKVWENAAQSLIGKQYIRSREGFGKRLLGKVLCLAVKRKAGIDRCKQLIVGSAPVSLGLLQNFRSIGIEVHNAYGLTEAPLITLNRYMANRIETVGEPLPDTQIRIADDGEVLVKGPQVMNGYYRGEDRSILQEGDSPLVDGWLHTGDYGMLTKDNHLILSGRKKEVIIDSYGKNINPVKIELMVREATGIDHVLLCGDNRPYCVALLWGCPNDNSGVAAIEEGISKVNEQLSHPEQVKKYVLLTETLSIEGGELTANLKMKRSSIASKYADVIENLYK